MNEVLLATWLTLIAGGVFFQMGTTKYYSHKRANQNGAIMSLIFIGSSLFILPAFELNASSALAALTTLYLFGNGLILYKWEYHPMRTRKQVSRSAFIIALSAALLSVILEFGSTVIYLSIVYALSVYLCWKVLNQLQRAQFKLEKSVTADASMPTLSVVVPARNETHALTKSLRSLVQTEYPKIEVIVADDCSQDDTSQIIRSFANDGVRFVQSAIPEEGWIGKNLAYKGLSDESSGDYILFSGVDVRYKKDSIQKLMSYMNENKLDMVSVLPRHATLRTFGAILQPFRYLSLLIASNDKHPASLSTVWIISRKMLEKHGGFNAVENSVAPEQYFAAQLKKKNKYSFILSSKDLGITTYKKASSQFDTAVRTLYPRLRKHVAYQFITILIAINLYLVPLFVLAFADGYEQTTARILSMGIVFFTFIPYLILLALSYSPYQLLFSPLSFVAGIVSYIYVSFVSMIRYERNEVLWKGRNICEPVMLTSLKKR